MKTFCGLIKSISKRVIKEKSTLVFLLAYNLTDGDGHFRFPMMFKD